MAASIRVSELPSNVDITPDDLLLVSDVTGGTKISKSLSLGALESYYLDTLKASVEALVALTGVATNSTSLGAFSGDVVDDAMTLKSAIQQLETSINSLQATVAAADAQVQSEMQAADAQLQANIDALDYVSPLDNINDLRANLVPDADPEDYFQLVVDKATGEIKVIDEQILQIIPG